MQRFESIIRGSTIAFVGQASRQAVQLPQKSCVSGASYSNSMSSKISPRKTQEPHSRVIKLECFPIQPNPARCAHALSIIGAVSTQIFAVAVGQISRIKFDNSRSFSFKTS